MRRIAAKKRRRVTTRFYINAALFALLLTLGILFREPYAQVRDALRAKIIGAAETIVSGITTSELSLKMPQLTLGANSRGLTGSGEQLDNLDDQTPANTGSNLSFDARLYPYRAMLNETAQAVYNQVYENALKLNDNRFTLVTPVTEEALSDIMNAVYNDHPELFWVDTAYSYGFLQTGSVVAVTLSFNDTTQNIERAQSEFDRAVQRIVDEAGKLDSAVDREKYVHDYIIERVSYNTAAPMNQSAYSALVGDASVCAGFSRAFQHVLMQLQIPCYYSTGTAAGGDHAWNIVELNGEHYNVDVAWDDATASAYGKRDYSYFNVPDGAFSSDHTRSTISQRLPKCVGTAMTYAAVYGKGGNTGASAASVKLPTYSEKGFSKKDILTSLDAYNAYCRDRLIQSGTGKHTFQMVLRNAALMHEVYTAAENESYVSGYAQAVVNELHLQDCSVSLELSGETLAEGYILLTQVITLRGTQQTVATAVPTAEPTAVPTVPLTPPPTDSPSPSALVTPPPVETHPPVPTQQPVTPDPIATNAVTPAEQADTPADTIGADPWAIPPAAAEPQEPAQESGNEAA